MGSKMRKRLNHFLWILLCVGFSSTLFTSTNGHAQSETEGLDIPASVKIIVRSVVAAVIDFSLITVLRVAGSNTALSMSHPFVVVVCPLYPAFILQAG